MAPSTVDVTHKLACCVCDENLETVSSLHYHQMCYHTTEELSLALITLKGLQLIVEDLPDSIGNEDAVLRTGLAKYPHFLLNQSNSHADSDSESTDTAEPSKLQGAITTLSGENVVVPVIKFSQRIDEGHKNTVKKNYFSVKSDDFSEEMLKDINVTPLKTGRIRRTKLTMTKREREVCRPVTLNRGPAENKCNQNFRRKLFSAPNTECSNKKIEKVMSNKYVNNSETNANTDTNSFPLLIDDVGSCVSEIKDESSEEYSAFMKSERSGPMIDSQNTFDMDCTNESDNLLTNSDIETHSNKYIPVHKLNSCSPQSSVDSVLSPGNSPEPKSYIKAIISRLPDIITPNADNNSGTESQGRRTSRKKQRTPRRFVNDNYVLPSPVSQHHRNSVLYDYRNEVRNDNSSKESVQFEDFFVPTVKLETGIDVECVTDPLTMSEKQIQTVSPKPSDDDSGIQVEAKEKPKRNILDQCANKQTQTGLLSVTTKRLASYRKPSTKKHQKEPGHDKSDLNNKINLTSKRKVSSTVNTTPKTNSLSPSNIPTSSNSDKVKVEVQGKVKNCNKSLMKIYPRGMTDRRFFCEPCGKGYKKKSHLERHVRVHTGERPFQCSHCDKSFAVRSILKQHVRTHTGEKPYACTICHQRFPQKSGLMTHTMLHTGKPFKCDRCDKAFVSNHKLLQHLKSHDGPRKYTCSTCGTEFFTEGAMLQHERSHNRMAPHLCMICGEQFQQETLLKFHLDQHLQKFNSIGAPV